MRHSLYMGPFVSLFTWLQMRGQSPGPSFCDTSETNVGVKLIPSKPLSSVKFVTFLEIDCLVWELVLQFL